jgi:outer membrane receptor protein involved in Fe transport
MMRASVSQDQYVRQTGKRIADYTYRNSWFEMTKASAAGNHEWVLGASAQKNTFDFRRRRDLEYSRQFIGLFAEDAYHASERFSLHVSGRHEWGDFDGRNSFRLAALYRRNSTWGVRMSVGGGQAVPGYAVPELSDYGPGALTHNSALKKESAVTTSLDIDWHPEDIELNIGIFDGQIKRALGLRSSGNELEVFNRSGVLEFKGIESTLRFVEGPWHVIGSWTLLDAARCENGLRSRLAYVPKNTGELAVLYEVPNTWRAGIEFSYSGSQIIEEMGLTRAPATLEVSMLLAKSFRELTLFVNAMNLTDVRQTKRFRLFRPDAAQSQLPVNEAWGSLTGRVVNIGLRREF